MRDALRDDGLVYQTTFRRPPHDMAHPRGVRRDESQMDLAFVAPVLRTPTREIADMVRGTDRIESQVAAAKAHLTRKALGRRILEIIATEGPQEPYSLNARVEFEGYGENNIRKRLSELHRDGKLVQVGRRNNCALLDIAGRGTPATIASKPDSIPAGTT